MSRSINWDSSSKDGHSDRRIRGKRKRAKNMSVLEARGEPLYLADRCAPCTAWALLRPTCPWRGRGPPWGPCMRALLRPTARPGERNHAKERQSRWTCLLFQRRSLSWDLVAWTWPPLCPTHRSARRYKPIRSEGRKGSANKLRGTRPTARTFSLSRGTKTVSPCDNCVTRWSLYDRIVWEFVGWDANRSGKLKG